MRFLGIGDYCDLSALYLRLIEEGHDVRVHIADPLCSDILEGLLTRVADWRSQLEWIREAGEEGIVLFESSTHRRGELQDELRRDGIHVVGGCAWGDRLENDRAYAQRVLAEIGLQVCPVHEFRDRREAIAFLGAHPGRYVLKYNGPVESFVGCLPDGRDVRALLETAPRTKEREHFVLMHHLEGIEVGVGAYFDGERFLRPAVLDWEHKRFFPGDLGELTGEMGTVVTYRRSARLHDLTLGRLAPLLRKNGYCGYINLNTIVNESGVWPLELTCRFGYPGYAILDPLQRTSWGELFHGMVTRSRTDFDTADGFAVGIVLTTPPFPYGRVAVDVPVGLPIVLDEALTPCERRHLHYGELACRDGHLVTAGAFGWTMVVTGTGLTVGEAQAQANRLAERILIPNVRYRRDIGDRLMAGQYDRLERLQLLS
jgi:phosphoribosylamine--glycine ligase